MRTLFLLSLLIAAAATAGETQVDLMDSPGRNEVAAECGMCHSLDYITMNAGVLDRTGWEKTVDKMIHVMDAPINDEDRRAIIDYLAQHYGK